MNEVLLEVAEEQGKIEILVRSPLPPSEDDLNTSEFVDYCKITLYIHTSRS
jgi:hypothetical protein